MIVRYILFIACLGWISTAQAGLLHAVYSDSTDKAPENWFNLDAQTSKIQGVSTEKTYEILKDKPAKKVIVAVIDSGVDPEHEDLRGKLWVNEDEKADNGIDDDQNGYVDDVHGWNFIGGADGTNVTNDTYELTREYIRLQKKYGDQAPEDLSKDEKAYYEKINRSYEAKVAEMQQERAAFQYFADSYHRSNQLLTAYLGVEDLTADSLAALNSPDEVVMMAKGFMEYALEKGFDEENLMATTPILTLVLLWVTTITIYQSAITETMMLRDLMQPMVPTLPESSRPIATTIWALRVLPIR